MIFDIVMYAAAIVTVIAFVGSKPKVSAPRQIVQDLEVLGAIAQALPAKEECFAVETTATVVKPVQSAVFDCGDRATFDEAMLVAEGCAMVNRYWGKSVTDNVVPFKRPAKAVKLVEYRNNKELRTKCREAGVSPSVGTGKNRRFLTVSEMVKALGEVGYEVHCVA